MKYIAGFLIALLLASVSLAQEADLVGSDADPVDASVVLPDVFEDQSEWDSFAARVELAISAGRASNTVLGGLRSELADWRDIFLARQGLNASRIATVRAQIAALGPVPEDGNVDPRVSQRRDALNAQLLELRAPVILAAEAHTQADGMIGEIDDLIRERQSARFTERSTSPLNPTVWARTWDSLVTALRSTRAEINGQISNPSRRTEFVAALPGILALFAVALVFVLRGRNWFSRLTGLIEARTTRGRGVVRFFVSLGQVIMPFLGLVALSSALILTGMMGRRLEAVLENVALWGLFPILAHWLAGHLLPKSGTPEDHPLRLSEQVSGRAHRRFVTLGYALMLFCLVDAFLTANSFDAVPFAVVMFPVGVVLAWPLYRFGKVLRESLLEQTEEGARSFRGTVRGLLSRGLMLSAVGGVVFAALGYSSALEVLTFPAAVTVYVLGILLLLQTLTMDTYTLVSKSETGAQTALMPVLIGFLLVLLALPILAVIWGTQVTDLTEMWARFQEGFAIGETRISPTSFLLFAVVFVVGYTVTRLVQAALRTTVLPRTKLDAGGQNAIVSGMGYVGIFLAAVIAITTAGIDLSGLAIVAGALSVGIGFGLQNIVSNFVSGIILLIERPISQGDWIEVGGQMGYVRDISVRSTRIETFDRTDVIVPNADLVSNQVTNWTRGNNVGRVIVPVGVAYGTDTEWVTSILKEIAEAHPMVLLNPGPSVVFQGFGADSLDFEIRAILRDVNYVLGVKSDMNHAIAKRFVEEGIEIPFAQRDLWLRNPETLQKGYTPAPTPPKPSKDGDT
ncbi:DUF3772 domain-containing protein [Octadecabacter sp. G9-8]|uniref:DUF3772 domain-containing protein n=1 Tax=Octadecabacter dasysiphoniae TaxID=2909341 RepID=A0ABS9CTK9_9RHOB|nr:DUF3772 domain-containing protein [Octadecabacter dasysiphoniae]MCF2870493.1 DUF3772 domain-containing protein [Octadecabacter dasysiphoniae]